MPLFEPCAMLLRLLHLVLVSLSFLAVVRRQIAVLDPGLEAIRMETSNKVPVLANTLVRSRG